MSERASASEYPAPDPLRAGPSGASAVDAASARRGVLAYLLAVIVLSGAVLALIIPTSDLALIPLFMWMPAVASIWVRLARKEGFADVSFSFGGRRTWIAIIFAFLLPFVVGFIAYGIAWAAGLVAFAPPESLPVFGDQSGVGAVMRFVLLAIGALLQGLVFGIASATGEEIGWRGYLVLRLIDARTPYPIVVSGVIWGLWHVPLILAGLYVAGPNPLLSVAVFMVTITALSVPMAWVRLASGSIWPAAALHGFWNIIIQRIFDRSTSGPDAVTWIGESDILTAITVVVIALAISYRHLPIFRMPPPVSPNESATGMAPMPAH